MDEFKRNISSYIEQFDKNKYDLDLYYQVTNSEELTEKQIIDILCWKLAGKREYEQLSGRKKKLIDRTIEKLLEINEFKKGRISNSEFDNILEYISPHGPIIRLFLLHICKPKEYELFDQHVFRSFYYFKTGEIDRGFVTFSKAKKYYSEYCTFLRKLCEEFEDKYDSKEIDGALMVYGKELKKRAKNISAQG